MDSAGVGAIPLWAAAAIAKRAPPLTGSTDRGSWARIWSVQLG